MLNSHAASSAFTPNSARFKLLIFALLTAIALFFQWKEGAYRSEFGGHPDEAAHCVTGLFARDALVFGLDYAKAGFHGSPIAAGKAFVEDYYAHYPKIGLGVWPPFFYLVQSAWTLAFGPSTLSLLLLMAGLAGLAGLALFLALEEDFGAGLAFAGSLIWLGLPLVQQYAGMLMAETLSTLLIFSATLRFGRYLDRREAKDAIAFGLFASAAILTKGTGLVLALVPIFSILITRRFSILKERSLWISGAIVLVLAGPWTFATRKLGAGGWEEPNPSWHFTSQALPYYGWKLLIALGFLIGGLALLGVAVRTRESFSGYSKKPALHGKWASCLALVASVVIFQSLIPAGKEARHLLPALPAAVMFAMAGVGWIAGRVKASAARTTAAAVVMLGFFSGPALNGPSTPVYFGSIGNQAHFSPFGILLKDCHGFGAVAEDLMHRAPNGKFLVSSDSTGEGMFIAEVALRENHRPTHTAKRASKELAGSAWNGSGYQPKYQTDESLLAYLAGADIDFVVLDPSLPERNRRAHHVMLKRVVDAHPEIFEPTTTQPLFRNGQQTPEPVAAYRILRRQN